LDPQQLATKVSQLESRVATLEDENKILRGEVKQILTEIRTAILVRDNPFEGDNGLAGAPAPHMAHTAPAPPVQEIHVHTEQPHTPEPPKPEPAPVVKEPAMLRPAPTPVPVQPEPEQAEWSLMTIAGLSAWAEEAMRRLGSLRLEILLDLCETAGHITPEARTALARVSELDIEEPAGAPATNETLVILRQLDALVNDGIGDERASLYRAA
jgi:outer membrane biosynthesis protein TonB